MTENKTPSEESLKEARRIVEEAFPDYPWTASKAADAFALTIDRYKERIREGEKAMKIIAESQHWLPDENVWRPTPEALIAKSFLSTHQKG